LLVRLILHKAVHFVGFCLHTAQEHITRTAWELNLQVLGSCLKAGNYEVHEPPHTDTNGTANAMQGNFLKQ
jgi:hypothetical protein